jgi:hypothetical protein
MNRYIFVAKNVEAGIKQMIDARYSYVVESSFRICGEALK